MYGKSFQTIIFVIGAIIKILEINLFEKFHFFSKFAKIRSLIFPLIYGLKASNFTKNYPHISSMRKFKHMSKYMQRFLYRGIIISKSVNFRFSFNFLTRTAYDHNFWRKHGRKANKGLTSINFCMGNRFKPLVLWLEQ